MSLSFDDLQAIRMIMREEMQPLDKRVETLENDVKDIYFIISDMQKNLENVKNYVGDLQDDMVIVKELVGAT